jgi:hypothetical protein
MNVCRTEIWLTINLKLRRLGEPSIGLPTFHKMWKCVLCMYTFQSLLTSQSTTYVGNIKIIDNLCLMKLQRKEFQVLISYIWIQLCKR